MSDENGQAGDGQQAGVAPDAAAPVEHTQPAIYRNVRLFTVGMGVLALIFLLVLLMFPDRPVLLFGLLAALLSFLLTGLLGGFGVFRSELGYVSGAGGSLLVMFGVFFGAAQMVDKGTIADLEEDKAELEKTNATFLSENDKFKGQIIELKEQVRILTENANKPIGVKLWIACDRLRNSEKYFKIADASIQGSGQIMDVPMEMHPDHVKRVLLYVSGYTAPDIPATPENLSPFRQVSESALTSAELSPPALEIEYEKGALSIKILSAGPLDRCRQ